MNRVLWLVNPFSFGVQEAHYVVSLIHNGNFSVTAVMLREWPRPEIPVYSTDPLFPAMPYVAPTGYEDAGFSQKVSEISDVIYEVFRSVGQDVLVSGGAVDATEGIVTESRFADMIFVSAGLNFSTFGEATPSTYILELLPRVQCPVLIIPDNMAEIQENIFTYNGGYSSLYAIRQFTYLFGHLRRLPVTVIYVEDGKSGLPHEQSLNVFLFNHYTDVHIKILNGPADKAIVNELMSRENAVVTFGAFGRNKISRFFRHSTATGLLRMVNVPVFVTHP